MLSLLIALALGAGRFVPADLPPDDDLSAIPLDLTKRSLVPEGKEVSLTRERAAAWLCRATAALGPPSPSVTADLRFGVRDESTGAVLALVVQTDYGILGVRGARHPKREEAAVAFIEALAATPSADCKLVASTMGEGTVYEVKDGMASARDATADELLPVHVARVARLDSVDKKTYQDLWNPHWHVDDYALNYFSKLPAATRRAHPEAVEPLRRAARRFFARPQAFGMSALGKRAMCSYITRLTRALPPANASDRALWSANVARACR